MFKIKDNFIKRIKKGIEKNKNFSEYLYFNLHEKIFIIVFLPIALIACIIKLLSFFINIQVGVYERTNRIGHFVADLNLLIKENINKKNNIILLALNHSPPNTEVYKLFKQKIFFFPKWVINPFVVLNYSKYFNFKKHLVNFNYHTGYDYSELKNITYKFNNQKGFEYFNKFGIDLKNNKFVCIYARDQNYIKNLNNFENFNHSEFRNADINNYKTTAKYLEAKGYYVFRFGKNMENKISFSSDKIIDYASFHQNDYLDVFLSKNCEFFIGNGSGAESISRIFDKPILTTNFTPIGVSLQKNEKYFCIFKKLFCNIEKKFLSIDEISQKHLFFEYDGAAYQKKNITVIENSEDEILEATKEFIMHLNGSYKENVENSLFRDKCFKILNHEISEDKNMDSESQNNLRYAGIKNKQIKPLKFVVSNYFLHKNKYLI